jgi:hypothetical protein
VAAPNSFSMTRRRTPRWLRIVGVLAAVLAVVALLWSLMVAASYAATWWRLGPSLATPSATVVVGTQDPRSPSDTHTLLVVVTGRDGALDAPPALIQYGGPRTRPVIMVIPRELTVVAVNDDRQDIADVHAAGGVVALRQAIIDFTEVAIDDVVAVSPRDVADAIDIVGGFSRCDPTCTDLTGAQFLAAYGVLDDYERLTYLASVVSVAADTIDRGWLVRHPRRTWRLVATTPQMITTTVSLRGSVLLRTFAGLRDMTEPIWLTTPLLRTTDGTVLAAPEPSMLQFAALRDGSAVAESATVTIDDLRQELRNEIRVAVANAAGIQGLAAEMSATLTEAGYQVVASGNATRFDVQRTEIVFHADDPRATFIAEEIAEQIDAVLRPQADPVLFERAPVDVLVLVGAQAVR